MGRFKDRVAIITGAGSGIGRALAEEMARRGAHVTVADVNKERVKEVCEAIERAGGRAAGAPLDVTDYEAVKKLVDDTASEHGRLDYIFNNAGIGVGGEARDITIEDWRAVIDVNLYGVVNGVAAAYPVMVEQGFGHIVNTSSLSGFLPFPGTVPYAATKHGIMGLSHSLRAEAGPLGVKVSVVCPGYVRTAIYTDSKMVKVDREKAIKPRAWMKGATPEECARVILRGVARNEPTILITDLVKVMWRLLRPNQRYMFMFLRQYGREVRKSRME